MLDSLKYVRTLETPEQGGQQLLWKRKRHLNLQLMATAN